MQGLREIDMAVVDLTPPGWAAPHQPGRLATHTGIPHAGAASANLYRSAWRRQWLAAHIRDALRMQKPLLVVGLGAELLMGQPGPMGQSAGAELAEVMGMLQDAASKWLPVAGRSVCYSSADMGVADKGNSVLLPVLV